MAAAAACCVHTNSSSSRSVAQTRINVKQKGSHDFEVVARENEDLSTKLENNENEKKKLVGSFPMDQTNCQTTIGKLESWALDARSTRDILGPSHHILCHHYVKKV